MRTKRDIVSLNEHGQYHGLCIYYYDNGNVSSKGRFVNGKLDGIYEWYWSRGELVYKDYYSKGKLIYTELSGNKIEFYI